jgi:hypothetical protein
LPQTAGDPIERALPELERCCNEPGFDGSPIAHPWRTIIRPTRFL